MTPEELHACHRWFPLTELRLLDGNPNVSDEVLLAESLDTFGWLSGIVVHNGVVVAGNHRVRYAVGRALDGLPGYDLSELDLSEAEVMARALAHNHTARAGANDAGLEAEALSMLADVDADLARLAGLAPTVDFVALPPVDGAGQPDQGDGEGSGPAPDLALRYFVLEYPAAALPDIVDALNQRRTDPDEPNSTVVARLIRHAHTTR